MGWEERGRACHIKGMAESKAQRCESGVWATVKPEGLGGGLWAKGLAFVISFHRDCL